MALQPADTGQLLHSAINVVYDDTFHENSNPTSNITSSSQHHLPQSSSSAVHQASFSASELTTDTVVSKSILRPSQLLLTRPLQSVDNTVQQDDDTMADFAPSDCFERNQRSAPSHSGTTHQNKRQCTTHPSQQPTTSRYAYTIPTSNRFFPLSDATDAASADPASNSQKEKIPPICVRNVHNYQLFLADIKKCVLSEFHTELRGAVIKVFASTSTDFRCLTSYFTSIKQEYYTFRNPSD